jgi:hypothetical protein
MEVIVVPKNQLYIDHNLFYDLPASIHAKDAALTLSNFIPRSLLTPNITVASSEKTYHPVVSRD